MTAANDNRRAGFTCLVLVLVTLAIYWPARHYEFVDYDDPEYVVENATVKQGLTWYGVEWAFVDAHVYNYHPITWLSHMLDCQLFGIDPGAHHLVNASIHSLNAALLFLALRLMTGAFWRSAFVAALFAWHPLRVESVAWISERKDVLSGLFFLFTLLAYTAYVKSKGQAQSSKVESTFGETEAPRLTDDIASTSNNRRSWFYWFCITFFTLGLLSKPILVTVPAVLLLLDFWPLRRIVFYNWPSSGGESSPSVLVIRLKQLIREKLPFVAISLGVGLATFFAQTSGGAVVPLRSEGLGERFATAVAGYLGYVEKTFWPRDLSFLYLRSDDTPFLQTAIAAVVLLSATSLACNLLRSPLRRSESRSAMAVGWLWFCVMLLPVSGLLQAGPQAMADRYSYLPSIGLGMSIAWSGHELMSRLKSNSVMLAVIGCTALCLVSILFTLRQVRVWQNTQSLMEHALLIDPRNYVAHQDLAVYLAKQGKSSEAHLHRQRAIELTQARQARTENARLTTP